MINILPYCQDPYTYYRRKTRVVYVGDVPLGGNYPIRVQSMTTTDTKDTIATVDQIIRLVEAGCEIVRVTVPSLADAENLKNIKAALRERGIKVPLVADIHFTPNAALKAVEYVEKVRINPGNYADRKHFEQKEYSDSEYARELERLETQFKPLVLKAKQYGVAMRIGTNHGSLSDRIMNRYGDTPEGMVESALEFVRICEKYGYRDLVLSMKASNPLIMIQAYRLLAARMAELGMDYPFHLGVTEAGDGVDGRMKSAVGIGSLLEDGIGDTIRVSLTEDPVAEIPVAYALVKKYNDLLEKVRKYGKMEEEDHKDREARTPIVLSSPKPLLSPMPASLRNPYTYSRRKTRELDLNGLKLGNTHPIRVEIAVTTPISDVEATLQQMDRLLNPKSKNCPPSEIIQLSLEKDIEIDYVTEIRRNLQGSRSLSLPLIQSETGPMVSGRVPLALKISPHLIDPDPICRILPEVDKINLSPDPEGSSSDWKSRILPYIQLAKTYQRTIQWDVDEAQIPEFILKTHGKTLEGLVETCYQLVGLGLDQNYENVLISLKTSQMIFAYRKLVDKLDFSGMDVPLLLRYSPTPETEDPLLEASVILGSLLCDGIGDAIQIAGYDDPLEALEVSYNLLQATRLRISRTDFISCPSCGRTQFDLQTTTQRIKSKMSHLKGVKIAIMGCIVNGPGEMADADFGYVGSGPRRVDLYVGKERVARNIPEEVADEKLIELIKAHGKWIEPSEPI
ncbi:MAG TPA: (E)-4-hydroxy-3-methylbut-2-enyl-diphosphate synthase [Candidatus Limnocylindrales bacterium]|nr:(E)-4-hydroxy-3-methylbut-2-enyl-diphosphate synthase [Candidatus Limnocylindrales bacterium]